MSRLCRLATLSALTASLACANSQTTRGHVAGYAPVAKPVNPATTATGSEPSREPPCAEPQRWIVGRAGRPISRNQLYTEGIAYYVEWAGDSTSLLNGEAPFDSLRQNIAGAFANALTMWGSSLLLIRTQLPKDLRLYVDSMNHCSAGFCLFQPPQAVEVACRQNASFIVRVYMRGGMPFPLGDTSALALAQVSGRTIALESKRHRYVYDPRLFDWHRNDSVNLTMVMAHELGHAFGLLHADQRDVQSVMKPGANWTGFISHPTRRDASYLARAIEQSVVGAAPGVLTGSNCQGFSTKSDPTVATKSRPNTR